MFRGLLMKDDADLLDHRLWRRSPPPWTRSGSRQRSSLRRPRCAVLPRHVRPAPGSPSIRSTRRRICRSASLSPSRPKTSKATGHAFHGPAFQLVTRHRWPRLVRGVSATLITPPDRRLGDDLPYGADWIFPPWACSMPRRIGLASRVRTLFHTYGPRRGLLAGCAASDRARSPGRSFACICICPGDALR